MSKSILLLTAVSILLGFGQVAIAGSPPVVPVQGILTDKDKVPVDGDVQVRFSIHDDETGGNELWFETQTVPVSNGLFTTYLGQVTALDLSIFRDNGELWLAIKVGSDEEMPRVHLGSSPFAGYAEYTGGGTLTELNCTDGQVAMKSGDTWTCAPLPDARHFVHWGSQACPGGYQLLYSGSLYQSGGAAHHAGSSVCAAGPRREVYRHYSTGYAWEPPPYCSVCAHPDARFCYSHWGESACPAGFSAAYTGYMYSAGQNDGYGGTWVCADAALTQGQNYERPVAGEGNTNWYAARPCAVCCSE